MTDLASEIKRMLPAREVVTGYGFQPNRGGFIQCPFHQGDNHGSLKVYDGDRGWHCFGCGRGGSVIDFTMELFGISFREACLRLNADFQLGLSEDKPTRADLSARVQARKEEAERQAEKEARQNQLAKEHQYWWNIKKQFEPQPGTEYIHPFYAEAIKRLPYLEWLLDGQGE